MYDRHIELSGLVCNLAITGALLFAGFEQLADFGKHGIISARHDASTQRARDIDGPGIDMRAFCDRAGAGFASHHTRIQITGAFDDFSKEGARGFAEMQATISADERARRGFDPDQSSRLILDVIHQRNLPGYAKSSIRRPFL